MTQMGRVTAKRSGAAARCAAALLFALLASSASAKDSVIGSNEGGFGRITLTLPGAHPKAQIDGGVLTLTFDRKISVDPAIIATSLPAYVSAGHMDADGKTYRFALSVSVRLHTSVSGDKTAIDLLPQSFTGTAPDLPPPPPPEPKAVDVASLPSVKVRAGTYPNFTRLVFDWPKNVPYSVFPGAGKLTVRFETMANLDLSAIDHNQPPWVKNAGWKVESKGTVVEFETDADSGYHDFRSGNRIVLDVLAPKTDATTYTPPGTNKPVPVTPTSAKTGATAPDNKTANTAQAAAVAATAAKLNPPPPAPAAAPGVATKPPAQLATASATPAAAPAPNATAPGAPATPTVPQIPAPPSADVAASVARNGVMLTFANAAAKPSAVFVRGSTVWIVIEGSQAFDPAKMKAALGTLPDAVEASSGDGLAILRITLKQPSDVSARAQGTALRVQIAPQISDPPDAIGFVRNAPETKDASLSTLVPLADRSFTLLDPLIGDSLIIVPGAPFRGTPVPHSYVEFATLKSASGLVLKPFSDDLDVTVSQARVTIRRQGGLDITTPSLAGASALGSGPTTASFLNFAAWSRPGADFSNTERRLREAAARLPSEDNAHARLDLARFYLANGFAAEALGIINLMEAGDPTLRTDTQLEVMRGAADYMMGRYREAHNELGINAFDADRHALLWRGLTDAALQNWQSATESLVAAEPVLARYPSDWLARARIAEADSALSSSNPELADAVLSRLPVDMPPEIALDAKLAHARLDVAEDHYRDAVPLFDDVATNGNERQQAEAIYYRTDAAITARAISPRLAAETLEKLRFRWRGDALEMETLRKLGSIYFASRDWRKGLQTLRVVVQTFPNEELARKAQDDMRAAFSNLFLKGQADKLPPIEALAIFYDFIDLTPIGPDGDEMIRRMSDRLAAVDLLGPAESLLNYQVTKRLDGVARAQVAARLAMLDLMDKKPTQALDTLRTTALSTLPDDVAHERMLLQARALASLKQWDAALDLISVDQNPDSAHLRADIYWESGNWATSGQETEGLLGQRFADTKPLTPEERSLVMRGAIAYSLANDETNLERFRDHFVAKMKNTPDAPAFAVLTDRIDRHGVLFRDLASQVASVDTLTTFMQDLRKRYPNAPTTN
jgi:hypothetical protein